MVVNSADEIENIMLLDADVEMIWQFDEVDAKQSKITLSLLKKYGVSLSSLKLSPEFNRASVE